MCLDYNCQPTVRTLQTPSPVPGEEPLPETIQGDVIFIGGLAPQGVIDYKFMDYMIIVSEQADGQRNWYYVKMDKASDGKLNAMLLAKKGVFEKGTPFAEASIYTSSRNGANYLYAVHDNKFYAMNPNSPDQLIELSFVSQPEGEVTYFQTMFEVTKEAPSESDYNCFANATYSGGKYTVALYDMLGGIPTKAAPFKKFEGEGKVKTIQLASQTRGPGVMGMHSKTLYSIHY